MPVPETTAQLVQFDAVVQSIIDDRYEIRDATDRPITQTAGARLVSAFGGGHAVTVDWPTTFRPPRIGESITVSVRAEAR